MDTDISTMFVKKFSVDRDLGMPNQDAMYIKTLLEDGAYKEACERLIDYYGENSVQSLNCRIHKLKDGMKSLEDEVRDLRRSNDAEHSEKVKYFDLAQAAAKILERIVGYDVASKIPDLTGTMEDAESFVNRAKSESLA